MKVVRCEKQRHPRPCAEDLDSSQRIGNRDGRHKAGHDGVWSGIRRAGAAAFALTLLSTAAHAATKVAVFDFELLDTSTEADIRGPKPDEARRLALITEDVRDRLRQAGYEVVDLAPQKAKIDDASPFRNCNSCELPIARAAGADIEVIGLVQKVSNLILNINFQLRDVADGKVLRAGSADIRNNTDESWMRGVSYLVRNRLLDPPLTGKAAAKATAP